MARLEFGMIWSRGEVEAMTMVGRAGGRHGNQGGIYHWWSCPRDLWRTACQRVATSQTVSCCPSLWASLSQALLHCWWHIRRHGHYSVFHKTRARSPLVVNGEWAFVLWNTLYTWWIVNFHGQHHSWLTRSSLDVWCLIFDSDLNVSYASTLMYFFVSEGYDPTFRAKTVLCYGYVV